MPNMQPCAAITEYNCALPSEYAHHRIVCGAVVEEACILVIEENPCAYCQHRHAWLQTQSDPCRSGFI